MGCFNKSCVVTGLQITYNDPIVGIKLQKEKPQDPRYYSGVPFDHIHSEWYPIAFPVRGVYDDYGRIEVDGKLYEGDEDADYDSTRCDDYMFVHEWAYDAMQSHHLEKVKEQEAKGYDKWRKERWESIEKIFAQLHDSKKLTDQTAQSMNFVSEMAIRASAESFLTAYFSPENSGYWFDKLYDDDFATFKANIERFRNELGFLESNRFEMGFQWHTSYVANREVDYDLRLKILKLSGEYINAQIREYEE